MDNSRNSFLRYYRAFLVEFGAQVWGSFLSELASTMALAIIVYALSYHHDTSASTALVLTAKACAVYLVGLVIYHLLRTPWKLAIKTPAVPPMSIKAEVIQLSETILDFVYERTAGAPEPPVFTPYQPPPGDRVTADLDSLGVEPAARR